MTRLLAFVFLIIASFGCARKDSPEGCRVCNGYDMWFATPRDSGNGAPCTEALDTAIIPPDGIESPCFGKRHLRSALYSRELDMALIPSRNLLDGITKRCGMSDPSNLMVTTAFGPEFDHMVFMEANKATNKFAQSLKKNGCEIDVKLEKGGKGKVICLLCGEFCAEEGK